MSSSEECGEEKVGTDCGALQHFRSGKWSMASEVGVEQEGAMAQKPSIFISLLAW